MNAPERQLRPSERHLFVVEWRDGFKIGVAQVDAEHQHLFTLVKELSLANVDETIGDLLEYIVTHFTHEQDLMESSGFPDFRQHLHLHDQFSTQVAEFLADDAPWEEERLHDLRRFLNKWLVGHILTHDLRFGRWYQEHAPAAAPKKKAGWFDRLLRRG